MVRTVAPNGAIDGVAQRQFFDVAARRVSRREPDNNNHCPENEVEDRNMIGGNHSTPMNLESALARGDGPAPAQSPGDRSDHGDAGSPLLADLQYVQSALADGRRVFSPTGTARSFGNVRQQLSVGLRMRVYAPRTDCLSGEAREAPGGGLWMRSRFGSSWNAMRRCRPLWNRPSPLHGARSAPEWERVVGLPSTPSHAAKAWLKQPIAALGQPGQLVRGYFLTAVATQSDRGPSNPIASPRGD